MSVSSKTIQDLEAERKEQGIQKSLMSELVGYRYRYGWAQAVETGVEKKEILMKAQYVLDYYEIMGIVPEPREVKNEFE
jgi:hypothetical protein